MDARLVRRHPEHAEERRQADGAARGAAHVPVELPVEPVRRLAAERDAPRAGDDLVDPDREHLPGAGAPHLDRAGKRVAGVELRVARDERLVAADVPARVRDVENRMESPGSTVEHGLELEREVPVQDRRVERSSCAQNASSERAASTTRATDGM